MVFARQLRGRVIMRYGALPLVDRFGMIAELRVNWIGVSYVYFHSL